MDLFQEKFSSPVHLSGAGGGDTNSLSFLDTPNCEAYFAEMLCPQLLKLHTSAAQLVSLPSKVVAVKSFTDFFVKWNHIVNWHGVF